MCNRLKTFGGLLSLVAGLLVVPQMAHGVTISGLDPSVSSNSGTRNFSHRQKTEILNPPKQKGIVIVLKQDLDALIATAARRNGMKATFSAPVTGELKNTSLPSPMTEMLERLSLQFDLAWGYSAGTLFVSPASKIKSSRHPVSRHMVERFKKTAAKFGPVAVRDMLKITSAGPDVLVSGPASQVDAISHHIQRMNSKKKQK